MRTKPLVLGLVVATLTLIPSLAQAFCGFYVAGADTKLYNNATMVTLMRDGTTTVLSMGNNYQGPPEDFAMVVPVPVVLEKKDVKTLSHDIFDRLDKLAAPRLVEYWEQDPCPEPVDYEMSANFGAIGRGGGGTGSGYGMGAGRMSSVVVEAQFEVGEYEIVILSAKDALGLETWLTSNGYKIPDGAAPFLKPYVEEGSKFFVAKVNPKKVTFTDGMAKLSPLRFHYTEKDFRLPVRLGLINAKDKQDLVVHILAKNKRFEVANYPNATIPTNLIVADEVRTRFGEFYAALFDATTEKNPGAVVTEYSWNANTCDPCPEPALRGDELLTLGLDVVGDSPSLSQPVSTRRPSVNVAQVRIGNATVGEGLDKNIVRRFVRRYLPRIRFCYESELTKKPNLAGTLVLNFDIKPDGTVARAKATGLRNKSVESCVAKATSSLQFPKPSSGKKVSVNYPLTLQSVPSSRGSNFGTGSFGLGGTSGWVLTRLHARYDRSSLGEDLVFKEASPIAGGQGGASDALSKTANEAGQNSFQGRYIIRHEWTGPIECESPQRGMWGGPPANVSRDTSTRAATDLAFAPRGGINLASMVREPIAALGTKPAPSANPSEASNEETTTSTDTSGPPAPLPSTDPAASADTKEESKGCSSAGGSRPIFGLLLLFALWRWRRRRIDLRV